MGCANGVACGEGLEAIETCTRMLLLLAVVVKLRSYLPCTLTAKLRASGQNLDSSASILSFIFVYFYEPQAGGSTCPDPT